jgi:tetratricopeptide (TPR) repeat protein
VISGIGRPDLVAPLRFDKRFEEFTATYPAGGFRLSLQRQLEESRARAIANPEELRPIVQLAYDLLDTNRLAEALSVLDETLAYLDTFGNSEYVDTEEQIPWIHNTRARVLMKQGNWDAAIAAQQASLAAATGDGISQHVNLGVMYYLLQRPEEALRALETIDESSASDYGRMAIDEVRVCAYNQMGETGHAERLIASMLARADDSFTVLKDALLCVDGKEDVLARLVIEGLSDPERRVDTLADLQDYLVPDHMTAVEAAKERRWNAIRARPDVAAAIEEVGKVLDWPVFRPMT